MDLLVSTEWLAKESGASDLRVVDATWFLPADGRNARAEFESAHIPGAVFFDLNEISDTSNPLPVMLPSPEKFASRCASLGIGDGNRIVVYDNSPYATAARVWWMFNLFGQHMVKVLDGGFAKWRAEGRSVESGVPAVRHRHFTVWKDAALVADLEQMKGYVATKTRQVIDARSAARFMGTEPESRPGVRSGHMPGAINLPYKELFNADGTYKTGEALRSAFTSVGIDPDQPAVATCGSGVTASVVAFSLALLGVKSVPVYDGSWAEWGARTDTPALTQS